MSNDTQFFKHLEVIVGDSAESLTAKLRAIPIAFHLLNVWSDGKKHYAHINAFRPLPDRVKIKLDQIK